MSRQKHYFIFARPIKAVSRLLGHGSEAITLHFYVSEKLDEEELTADL